MGWIIGIMFSAIILLLTNKTIANLKSERDFYKERCVYAMGGRTFNGRVKVQNWLESQYRIGADPNPNE
jgi:hypothetical protein